MKEELRPAIEALQKELTAQEQEVIDTKNMINMLCKRAGMEPIYPDVGQVGQTATLSSIQGDTFYGKSILTAAREYLEMRKSAGQGPATPREVYEALKKGGFQFSSKSENNSITIVRATMGKASNVFHRLPAGDYGLLKWYDPAKIKRARNTNDDTDSADSDQEAAE